MLIYLKTKSVKILERSVVLVLVILFSVIGLSLFIARPEGQALLPIILLVLVSVILLVLLIILLGKYKSICSRVIRSVSKTNYEPEKSPEENLARIDDLIDHLTVIDRDYHLIRLMKDNSPNLQPILDELKHYGIDFIHDGFILVAFNACRSQYMDPPRHFRKRDLLMREIMESSAPEGMSLYALDLEDLYISLFNIPFTMEQSDTQKIKKQSEEYAKTVIGQIESEFNINTSVAISELHKGVTSLTDALKEVHGLFEYKNITENSSKIIHYDDYYISFDSWYDFGNTYHKFDEVRRLITSIQVGDFTNAQLLINELIENDYSCRYPSLLLARCRLYGIIDAAVNAMGLVKEELDYEFLKKLEPTTRIVNCSSYSELQAVLNSIFDDLIAYYASKKKDRPPEWFETILQYINSHYNDVNINVATVAEHFKISSAYYARVFKRIMGISPLDYIHKLRMRSAKRLMSKGVSVKDAASIVGYGNPITMSRAFKRYEGVTPGSYLK